MRRQIPGFIKSVKINVFSTILGIIFNFRNGHFLSFINYRSKNYNEYKVDIILLKASKTQKIKKISVSHIQ